MVLPKNNMALCCPSAEQVVPTPPGPQFARGTAVVAAQSLVQFAVEHWKVTTESGGGHEVKGGGPSDFGQVLIE